MRIAEALSFTTFGSANGAEALVLSYIMTPSTSQIHDVGIDKRRSELLHMASSKQHAMAKCKELEALQLFLRTRNTNALRKLDVFAARPRDIVDFVISSVDIAQMAVSFVAWVSGRMRTMFMCCGVYT